MHTVQTESFPSIQASAPAHGVSIPRTERWQAFYELTKPGITKMVVLSSVAGYYLAIPTGVAEYFSSAQNIFHAVLAVIGTTLVSGGSCALNHFMERDYDAEMQRTKRRPLPSGKLVPADALIFGTFLAVIGLLMLAFVNIPTLLLAVATIVSYNAVYTPMKRVTSLSTLVGAIPGALPALGGWVAVRGTADAPGLIMFLILFFWQIPHFLALSWMYREDYAEGGFPMLSVTDPTGVIVARQTLIYIAALVPVSLMLTALKETGLVYFAGVLVVCGIFLFHGVRFLQSPSKLYARKVLLSSYVFLLGVIMLVFADKL